LTLPRQTIAGLGLPWRSSTKAVLATGNVQQLDIHTATIIWDGKPRTVLIQAIDATTLLGMALLIGYDLRARIRPGGAVEIEAIP
jgi:predicted aspartyl protease